MTAREKTFYNFGVIFGLAHGFTKELMNNLTEIELYNMQEGDSAFVPMSARENAPAAEYFTAERSVTDDEAAEGIKRVTLTFRKIAKDSGGHGLVAGVHNGEKLFGVLVRTVFHYEE